MCRYQQDCLETPRAACHWGAISESSIRAVLRPFGTPGWRCILCPFSFVSSHPLRQQPAVEVRAKWDVIQEASALHLFEQQIIIPKFLFPAKYCGLPQEVEMVMELHIFLVHSCSCANSSRSLGSYQPQLAAFPNWACGAKQQNRIGLNWE